MATSGDTHGTMIEVYPERATLDIPKNDDQVVFGENATPPDTWPFHVLLSVPLGQEAVERIGAREGWRAKTFGRGMQGHKPFFHVIEFWLENRLMIEVAPPDMAREYQDFLKNARTAVMSDPESVRNFSVPLPSSRSQVHLTSAAVNGLPSCHLTPWRNLKVSAVFSASQDQLQTEPPILK